MLEACSRCRLRFLVLRSSFVIAALGAEPRSTAITASCASTVARYGRRRLPCLAIASPMRACTFGSLIGSSRSRGRT